MKKRLLFVVLFSLLCAVLLAACSEKVKYDISVHGTEGGRISLSVVQAAEGETVRIECIPDEGFAFKEGSLKANGEPVTGNAFTMPAEDVIITGEFLSTDYFGAYAYSAYGDGWAKIHDFIQINEETLTVGVTKEDFDYAIYENIPYSVDNFVLTATVNGEEWTAEIENGVLRKGDREYTLTAELTLLGTYTELQEQSGKQVGYIERDYAFSDDGSLVRTTYLDNGTTERTEMTYSLYGSFLYIEEPNDFDTYNRKRYGVLEQREYGVAFLHNWFHRYSFEGVEKSVASYNLENLYPKREEITLKENGAYILKETVNPYTGKFWDSPRCYDFLSLRDGKLTFSRHGVSYVEYQNQSRALHFVDTDTEYVRFGNALRVFCTLNENDVENDYSFVFHIIGEDTIYLQDTMNTVQKFEFVKDIPFERAYRVPFTNEESLTEEVLYYDDGVYGDMYFNKESGALVKVETRGYYKIYGNLILSWSDSPVSSSNYEIAEIIEQDPATSEHGCDYKIFTTTVWWNDFCDGKSDVGIWFWKKLKGWEITQ